MRYVKNFIRRKLINNKQGWLSILGLVMGMFTFLFIFFYVYVERNYDQHLAVDEN